MPDFSATPDDPSGYRAFRSFMTSAVAQLDALGISSAEQMRTAANWAGSSTEWLGESAFAIKATLADPQIPADLVAELLAALEAIRVGFRRVGTEPTF